MRESTTVTRPSGRRFTVVVSVHETVDGFFVAGAHAVAQNETGREFPHPAEYAYNGTVLGFATEDEAGAHAVREFGKAVAAVHGDRGFRAAVAADVEDEARRMEAEAALHDQRVAAHEEGLHDAIYDTALDEALARHEDDYDDVAEAEALSEYHAAREREERAARGYDPRWDEVPF